MKNFDHARAFCESRFKKQAVLGQPEGHGGAQGGRKREYCPVESA